MTVKISFGGQHDSDQSVSDEDDSGVHVSDEYDDESWEPLPYPDEVDSVRPRTSHTRTHGSRSASRHHQSSRRQMISDNFPSRPRRHSPESPDSRESEDIPGNYPRERRWPPVPPAPGAYPAQSTASGHSFAFPPGAAPFPHQGPSSDQLVHLNGQPYPGYPYGPQYPPPHGAPMHQFFPHDQVQSRHPSHQPQSRMDPQMPHPMGPQAPSAYPGSPYHEMIHYPSNYYNNFRPPFPMYQGMVPQSYFPTYPQVPSPPSQPEPKSPPPAPAPAEEPKEPPPKDTSQEEAIARLEKLIMDERTEREEKEKARLDRIQREAEAAAALERQLAHDRKITTEAAALARADAEAKAAEDAAKAKDEASAAAAKAKEEATAAAATAASEAAAAATEAATAAAKAAVTEAAEAAAAASAAASAAAAEAAAKPAPEKKKPIKFKDAVGRKFSFPFELCASWQGMEDLIKQAFLHIDVIGPHVAEGHYDLVGPNGDIILPQVWDTVVEPDWSITMHMWPIPEKPKDPDPPPAEEPAPAPPVKTVEPKKPIKKAVRKPGEPLAFTKWMIGSRPRPKAAAKKPAVEPVAK